MIIWLRSLPDAMRRLLRRVGRPVLALALAAMLLAALLPAALAAGAAPRAARDPGRGATPIAGGSSPLACGGTPNVTILATPPNGTAPLSVLFSAAVTGGCAPYEVEWEFGDGGEASGANVTHVFRGAGVFDVLATAIDQLSHRGSNRTVITVSGGAGPVSLTVALAPASGVAPLGVTAWANVTGGNVTSPTQISWSFGDGGSGSGSPIRHLYTMAGSYAVTATYRTSTVRVNASASVQVASGGAGTATTLDLSAEPSPSSPPAPVVVQAESNAIGAPFNLTVCFGDGTPCAFGPASWSGSDAARFDHVYTTAGNYSVNGTLTNASGAVATASVVVVVLPGTPLSDIVSVEPTSGSATLSVSFSATVSGGLAPYAVQWSFGDGSVGASRSGAAVVHAYTAAGTYAPTLVINDSAGHTLTLALPHVVVSGPSAGFLPTSVAGLSTDYVLAILALAAVVAGVGVGRWALARTRLQRLKREGEQLVRQLEQRL